MGVVMAATRLSTTCTAAILILTGLFVAGGATAGDGGAPAPSQRVAVTLVTATPGGGFPVYGDAAAAVINGSDQGLAVVTRNTKGSLENIPLLERGEADIGLVAGIPAHEALAGIGRAPTKLKVIAAMYSDFGLFAVGPQSAARTARDFAGQPVAWGTRASGLTALSQFAMSAIGLDRDRDFRSVFVENAGDAPGLLARGEVAAIWGGGIGWPNFRAVSEAGGRLIGFTAEEVANVVGKHPFLTPVHIPAGSFPGQSEPLASFGSWSMILARADLPDDIAYRLSRALHIGHAAFVARLPQARETTPENTILAAQDRSRIHPGADRYLREIGR